MNDQTVDMLRVRLLRHRGRYHEISRISGLSHSWLCKFALGHRGNPTVGTIGKLQGALDAMAPVADDAAGVGRCCHVDAPLAANE